MWGQLGALLRLRYQLFFHGLTSGKAIGVVVISILMLGAALVSVVLTVVAFRMAQYVRMENGPEILLAVLDGAVVVFAFFWLSGLLFELQRNDPIDFRRMLFLPVSLRMVYILNFCASLLSPALAFFFFPLLGLVFGLAYYVDPVVLLALPAVLIFYIMAGAWSYFARGLLAMLMQNKRRRRLVLTIVPLSFVMLSQVPYLLTQSHLGPKIERVLEGADVDDELVMEWIQMGSLALPPGWMPYAVYGLLRGQWLASGVVTGGLGLLALAGIAIGYRTTLRHYLGVEKARRGKEKAHATPAKMPLTGRALPMFAEDTAALAQANFLSYLRHPNIRMLLIMPIAMGMLLLFVYAPRMAGEDANPIARAFLPAAILVWPFFNFGAIIFNAFGIDRHGFRGLILLPTPRYRFLLAKNLALFPFVGGLGFVFVSIGFAFSGAPPRTLLIAILQVIQLYLLFSTVGNFISIYFPYRIASDSMRAPAGSTAVFIIGLVSSLLVLVLLIPSALCLVIDDILRLGWSYTGPSAGLILSVVMIALTAVIYRLALGHAGAILQQREQQILTALLRENA